MKLHNFSNSESNMKQQEMFNLEKSFSTNLEFCPKTL